MSRTIATLSSVLLRKGATHFLSESHCDLGETGQPIACDLPFSYGYRCICCTSFEKSVLLYWWHDSLLVFNFLVLYVFGMSISSQMSNWQSYSPIL